MTHCKRRIPRRCKTSRLPLRTGLVSERRLGALGRSQPENQER